MESSLNRFKEKFIEEAAGLLDRLEKDLLELENKPADKDLIESAFRTMHTIKGSSSMFGFDFICEFTHNLESLYQLIRDQVLSFNSEIFEITFQSVDHIRKLLFDEKFLNNVNQQNHHKLLDKINGVNQSAENLNPPEEKEDQTERTKSSWHILLRTSEEIFFRGINLVSIFSELSALGEFEISRIMKINSDTSDLWNIFLYSRASEAEIREVFLFIEDDCSIVRLSNNNVLTEFPGIQKNNNDVSILDYVNGTEKEYKNNPIKQNEPSKNPNKRISVDALKLDQLMFLVSELVTVNSQLTLSTRSFHFDIIRPYLEKLDNLSKYFRNNALEIRLVPLSDTVLRFKRLIRDLSRQLNKKINFETQGINTELDKNTIDQLTEPLMHIIRNCIDHGIENPQERIQKGKPETGTITLSAYNSGNNVYISISDDGRGIDARKVRDKAIEKGFLKSTDKPSKADLYNFILLPGFSTATDLTEVSGRGVGMDVVKRRINDLRGEIFIDSEPDIGTTFTLKLQQSMSITDSLLFSVGDTFFTVPLSEIAICTQVENSELKNSTSTISFNDHLIPFINLRLLFKIGGEYSKDLKSIIIRNNEREIALLCDNIIGEHQAVLKPLGKSFSRHNYITAASQMGDGSMAFMIDTNMLFKQQNI